MQIKKALSNNRKTNFVFKWILQKNNDDVIELLLEKSLFFLHKNIRIKR